jgi:hypothetical protein
MNKLIILDKSVFTSDGTKMLRIAVIDGQGAHNHDVGNSITDALVSAYSYISLPHVVSVYITVIS